MDGLSKRDLEIVERFAEYKTTIRKLESTLKIAEEALEFYGDKKNWHSPLSIDPHFHPCISIDDAEQFGKHEFCGKRARQAIKQIKEMREEE